MFANSLIDHFEKGTLYDCPNGRTLRSFLSKKLHCAPMRISKKFAGKSIGKHVFLSRLARTPHADMQDNSTRMRQLEYHFHLSLLREGGMTVSIYVKFRVEHRYPFKLMYTFFDR